MRYRDGGANIAEAQRQDVQRFQAYMESPNAQADRQKLHEELKYLETQTPAYNATGDQATVRIGPMTEQLRAANLYPQITFVKKDGRWHLQPGNPFGW